MQKPVLTKGYYVNTLLMRSFSLIKTDFPVLTLFLKQTAGTLEKNPEHFRDQNTLTTPPHLEETTYFPTFPMILAQISLLTTRKAIGLYMMLCIQFSPVTKWNVFTRQRGLPFRPHFVSQKQRTKAMVMHIQNDRKRRGVRCERCQRRTHISLLALHVRD